MEEQGLRDILVENVSKIGEAYNCAQNLLKRFEDTKLVKSNVVAPQNNVQNDSSRPLEAQSPTCSLRVVMHKDKSAQVDLKLVPGDNQIQDVKDHSAVATPLESHPSVNGVKQEIENETTMDWEDSPVEKH